MQLDTIPNFNLVKCSVDKCLNSDNKEQGNVLINLNYVFRIKKYNEELKSGPYDAPAIWFYHNLLGRDHDVIWWHYPNTQEGHDLRNKDFEHICSLCK